MEGVADLDELALVEFDSSIFQQFNPLLLERFHRMMFWLLYDVLSNCVKPLRTHRDTISFLPREIRLFQP